MNNLIKGTVPCSICGSYPIKQGGHHARLVCPNYKNKDIKHGNMSSDTKGLAMGFTNWNYNFWADNQAEKSMNELIIEWNTIHKKD